MPSPPRSLLRIWRAMMNRLLGDRGERAAAAYLRRKGLRLITRGYRTSRGEIDLVMHQGGLIVFVEVKTRRKGEPAEAVTPEKQRRLARAAEHFRRKCRLQNQPCRFDVVAVVWPDDHSAPQIQHFPHAFDPPA